MIEPASKLVHQTERTRKLFLDRGGKLDKRPPPSLESTRSYIPDRWGRNPGRGLNIARILSIFRTADYGYPATQCDLIDDTRRRDGHLLSHWLRRLAATAGKPWIIQAGGERPADIRAAELLNDRIRRVPNVRRFLRHMLKHKYYGWSAAEIRWDEVDGVFAPTWFENVEHRRFIFDELNRPRLVVDAADKSIPLEHGRWVYMAADEGPPAAAAIMRAAILWAHFKSLAVRDWVLFNERFGMPVPIGTYGDGTPPEEKEALDAAVQKVGTDFTATFHESCKITSLALAGGASPEQAQGSFIALCNAEQSKIFSGATLTSGEGTSTGSYAMADVHADSEYTFTSDDEQDIGDMFEQQIGVPFVEWNGFDARPPRIKEHIARASNPIHRMDLFGRALEMGLEIDADQIRQEFQIKKPTGETLKKAAPPPSMFGQPREPPDADPDEAEDDPEEEAA